ncbi:MAG: SCO family protein [Candidatus Baltobacteraceae bacterium]
MRQTSVALGLLLGAVAVSPVAVLAGQAAAKPDVSELQIGDLVPSTTLIDQNGAPFSLAGFRGQPIVLTFVYTRCKERDECPLISGKFHELQSAFAHTDTHLVEVTLDPRYDRPAALAKYARQFDANPKRWTFGTGDPKTVFRFDSQFGVDPYPSKKGDIIHGLDTAVIDRSGVIRNEMYDARWSPKTIIAEVNALPPRNRRPWFIPLIMLVIVASMLCGWLFAPSRLRGRRGRR